MAQPPGKHVDPMGPWGGQNAGKPVDPRLRLLFKLVEQGDEVGFRQMLGSGGVRQDQGMDVFRIPLKLRLTSQQVQSRAIDPPIPELHIPSVYLQDDAVWLPDVSGWIDIPVQSGQRLFSVMKNRFKALIQTFEAVGFPEKVYPLLENTLPDLNPPQDWIYENIDLDGRDVVIGIIDDGCTFAHRHFIKQRGGQFRSRIRYLWDQTEWENAPTSDWKAPADFGYGYELKNRGSNRVIDAALNSNVTFGVIDENAVYQALNYGARWSRGGMPSHGAHVMDVAAGSGGTFAGRRGVAPAADIVFVQLPAAAVNEPDKGVLGNYILDGVHYIFRRAKKLGRRAVVNISYGGYEGPHDGSTLVERHIDALVEAKRNRAVVISAGNGFEADCHARREIDPSDPQNSASLNETELRWILNPGDPTRNQMEIWYPKSGDLEVEITHREAKSDRLNLGKEAEVKLIADPSIKVGLIQHQPSATANDDNCIFISLQATDTDWPELAASATPLPPPAPYGIWTVRIINKGANKVRVDAWISHDRPPPRQATRYQQSRFHVDDSDPTSTLGSFSNGERSIVVGGYNTWDNSIARYSACGPTRPTGASAGRSKPEVCAPAASDFRGRGVMSAEALSGIPRRMNGTSISAPHVTGLIALALQFAHSRGCRLKAADLYYAVTQGANRTGLHPDDAHEQGPRKIKQSHVLRAHLIGFGRIDLSETLRLVKQKCP